MVEVVGRLLLRGQMAAVLVVRILGDYRYVFLLEEVLYLSYDRCLAGTSSAGYS